VVIGHTVAPPASFTASASPQARPSQSGETRPSLRESRSSSAVHPQELDGSSRMARIASTA
jgi:hypothetical protein